MSDDRLTAGLARQLAVRHEALAAGASHVGWKVGFGAPAAKEAMRLSAPLVGYLTDTTVLDSGATVDVSGWARAVIEFEVAVWMGSDLPGGVSSQQAADAVASIGPAIELADIGLPLEPDRVPDILAGDIFHRAVVFGDADTTRAGIELDGLTARVVVDGEVHSVTTELEALTGRYPDIVATVADSLSDHRHTLRAGDVIITGSVIAPLSITPGSEYVFELAPFDPIQVSAAPRH